MNIELVLTLAGSASLCVAWRAGDERSAVRSFVELALSVARDGVFEG
jgi:hypothetical protein